ncbi:hypothetical protein [Halonotius pteroides]|uniref:Uncharacterized protein n=1 Tax=Halonotius pteroides TaxID=268735 RepID=A0A3A6Q264_9EURY|nr:hypothetical protein [Halonotius pteroides]RJX47850.1 hypothetical protein DP106_13910 [Halonotius pteroides]
MTELQSPLNSPSDYHRLAEELIAEYDTMTEKQPVVGSCSDKLTDRNLVVYDEATEQPVAELAFDVDADGCAHLTTPADYTLPTDREPFTSIDAPESLPPAGQILWESMQLIEMIIQSQNDESTHKHRLAELLEQLHHQHDYSPETIQTGLVETAQKRGELPIDSRLLL